MIAMYHPPMPAWAGVWNLV